MKEIHNTNRIPYIDSLKGIMIIFVILGHCERFFPHEGYLLYSTHVPLFFVLAGFFCKPFTTKFFTQKCKKILLPYILSCFILLLSILFYAIITNNNNLNIKDHLLRCILIDYGPYDIGPNWFLIAYLISISLYSLLQLIWNDKSVIFICIILFFIGEATTDYTHNIFKLNSAITALPFICFGNIYHKYNTKIKLNSMWYLFLVFLWIPNLYWGISVHLSKYPLSFLSIISSITISITWLQFGDRFNFKIFRYIGNHTLLLLCVHSIAFYLLNNIYNFIHLSLCNKYQILIVQLLYYFSVSIIALYLQHIFEKKKNTSICNYILHKIYPNNQKEIV